MTTFRELETFVAVADMGSFERAAGSIRTSQSAVSRLIKQFEAGFSRPLFDRRRRSAALTLEGQEILRLARMVLRQRDSVAERFASPLLIAPSLRIGVTELTATTWLPTWVGRLRDRYPRIHIGLEVASSPRLHVRLRDGSLDIAIVMDSVRSTNMVRFPIGSASLGWFRARRLRLPAALTMDAFERQTLLIQGESTGAGMQLSSWFEELKLKPASLIRSDSLTALLGLAAAGLGLAGLPRAIAFEPVRRGVLREVKISLQVPSFGHVALIRTDSITAFHQSAVQLARDSCDFDRPFQLEKQLGAEK